MTVLARHPSWSQCVVCGRIFTSDEGSARHMTSPTSRTCKDPATVRSGNRRLVFDDVYGAWRVQTGDTPPARRTPPPARSGRARSNGGAARQGGKGGAAMEARRQHEGPARQPAPSQRPVPSGKVGTSLPHGGDSGGRS